MTCRSIGKRSILECWSRTGRRCVRLRFRCPGGGTVMAKKDERLVETRLGRMRLPESQVLSFPRGLIGFMGHREFTLPGPGRVSFPVLQSLTDPSLGLLVTDPYQFLTDYEVVIGEADLKVLGVSSREQVTILVTVTIPQGMPERTTLNLSGPIIVNNDARIGLRSPDRGALSLPFHPRDDAAPQKKRLPNRRSRPERRSCGCRHAGGCGLAEQVRLHRQELFGNLRRIRLIGPASTGP